MQSNRSRGRSKGRQFWADHIDTWSRSDLNQTAYCRQNNISKSCFYNWKSKLHTSNVIPVTVEPLFAPKATNVPDGQADPSTIEITLNNGVSCKFPTHMGIDSVLPWLRCLRELT